MTFSPDRNLWAVILAGGIGSRFWPASTPARPKQLLPLASDQPLIRDTVDRILPLIPLDRIRILTGDDLVSPIREAVPELRDDNFLVEPRAAGTAPILAWAAVEIARTDPDGIMISLHSDHVIDPPARFREVLAGAAALAAEHQRLFTLGAVPDRPETGYGYIHRGADLRSPSELSSLPTAYAVDRFVEKPDSTRAAEYLASGEYLWNTGIFIWRAQDLLHELERHTPEIAPLIPELQSGDVRAFFDRVPSLTIDVGLLERSDRVTVIPTDFNWDDVGAWDALFRTMARDAAGNVTTGDAFVVESRGSAIYADDGPVVAFGVEDLIIVRTNGICFACPRDRAADLKNLLEQLPERLRRLDDGSTRP